MLAGLPTMMRTHLRTSRITLLSWTVGIAGMFALTVITVLETFGPQERALYEDSVGSGPAVLMLNGRVAGLDTVGGITANEFAFFASFVIPLMGAALMSRLTRKDEEAGRWELVLAGPVHRVAPMTSAWLIIAITTIVTCLAMWASTLGTEISATRATLLVAGYAGLAAVFAGVAFVYAQLFDNARSVLGASLGTVLVSVAVRGIGAVTDSPILWFSPHGWADELRPFGDAQGWPLALFVVTVAAAVAAGMALYRYRDAGAGVWAARRGHATASQALRSQLGLAAYLHRGNTIGWLVGVTAFMGIYGSVSQTILDAAEDTPSFEDYLPGGDTALLLDAVIASFVMMLALLTAAYAISAAGTVTAAERTGRLELELSRPVARTTWWGTHALAVVAGTTLVGSAGAFTLAAASAAATGDGAVFGTVLTAVLRYVPAIAVCIALPLFLYGVAARFGWVAWTVFAASAVIAFMGELLKLPETVVENSLFVAAGQAPVQDPDYAGIAVLCALAVALFAAGWWRFTRRDVSLG